MALSELQKSRNKHLEDLNLFLSTRWGLDSIDQLIPCVLLLKDPGLRKCQAFPLKRVEDSDGRRTEYDYQWRGVTVGDEATSVQITKNNQDRYDYRIGMDCVRHTRAKEENILNLFQLGFMATQLTIGYPGGVRLDGVHSLVDKINGRRKQMVLVDFDYDGKQDAKVVRAGMVCQLSIRVEKGKLETVGNSI